MDSDNTSEVDVFNQLKHHETQRQNLAIGAGMAATWNFMEEAELAGDWLYSDLDPEQMAVFEMKTAGLLPEDFYATSADTAPNESEEAA